MLRRLLKKFAKDELGSEMAEFALALAIFSLAALAGWGLIADRGLEPREHDAIQHVVYTILNPP